jgi:peptidoglycan/xylan/chitin deacetylase (PgdA/CDA1 family)
MILALLANPSLINTPNPYLGQITRKRISTTRKQIALTFDDGPDPKTTPIILDHLKAHQAKATFFVLGKNAKNHPELLRRITNEGHNIGTHSYSHRASMSPSDADKENTQTQILVAQATGITTVLFRPPYGLTKSNLTKDALRRNWAVFNWSATAADTATTEPEVVYKNVCFTPNPGEIILLHDVKPHTALALPKILTHLKSKGFEFVTLARLTTSPNSPAKTP